MFLDKTTEYYKDNNFKLIYKFELSQLKDTNRLYSGAGWIDLVNTEKVQKNPSF